MKSKVTPIKKNHPLADKTTQKPLYTEDIYNPLEVAKETAIVSTLLGNPQTVAQSYKEIIEYNVDEELKRFPK